MVTHSRAGAESGFTLIELLVVMIIIGILAAIAIPTFLTQRRNAYNAGLQADLHSVADEVESYLVDQAVYPPAVTQAGQVVTIGAGFQRVTVNNTIVYTLSPAGDAYCLDASNPKASHDRTWISNAGGLQPSSVTTCPF